MTWTTALSLRLVLASGTVLLAASACASAQTAAGSATSTDAPTVSACDGITVTVVRPAKTGGPEDDDGRSTTCVQTDRGMTAEAALTAAAITVTGTAEAGAAVVCRVDGDPDSTVSIETPGGGMYSETCASAPPDYAHWVVWRRHAGGSWDSTEHDITTLDAAPGDTVALVFTYRGEPPTPDL